MENNFWIKLIGRWRLLFGNCPACNSDAPEMYKCNICDFKNNYNGRKKSEDRIYWWNRFNLYLKNGWKLKTTSKRNS